MDTSLPTPADVKTLSVHGDDLPKPPSAEAPAAELEPFEAPCPRCGGKLVNPQNLGWCPKCGYCRSLVEDAPQALRAEAAPVQPPSPLGVREFTELLSRMPQWLRVLLAGVVAIAMFSILARLALPMNTLARAIFCTLELMLAVIGLILAQAWALMRIAPEEDALGAKDIILAGRLWGLAFKRLPEMRKQVWMGSWCVTAGISAVLLVGGFSYWAQFYRPKKLASKDLVGAVADAAEGEDKSLGDSVQDFANSQDLTKPKDGDKDTPKEDTRPTVQCVVIGYTVENKQLTGLLVATVDNNRLTYAGTVKQGFDEEQSKEILQLLATAVRPDPLIKGLKMPAIWVKPEVFCEVHQSGKDREGRLINMNFSGLLKKQ
ncbi:MAG TPA: hypothetical protein VGY58_15040 [Gemmataceae bacterium]|nr:hypothetical protein [Gemmataceae bacterium]